MDDRTEADGGSWTYPRWAMKSCPSCHSKSLRDPIATRNKIKYLILLSFFPYVEAWAEHIRPYRKCNDCGLMYRIRTHESLFCWIALVVYVSALVANFVILYVQNRAP